MVRWGSRVQIPVTACCVYAFIKKMKFQKFGFWTGGSVFFLGLLLFSACSSSTSRMPEAALPADADTVFLIDYATKNQREKIANLLEKFENKELAEDNLNDAFFTDFLKFFNRLPKAGDLSYEKDLSPLLKSKWKLAMGMDYEKKNFYLVAWFQRISQARKLLSKVWDLEKKEDENFEYSVDIDGNIFVTEVDDFILIANDLAALKKAVQNLDRKSGFDGSAVFQKKILAFGKPGEDYFAYFYAKKPANLNLKETDVIDIVSAEEKGLRLKEKVNFNHKESLKSLNREKLSLIEKVPMGDPILYLEDAVFSPFFDGFQAGLQNSSGKQFDVNSWLKKNLAVNRDFFDAPFAMQVSDVGTFYPAIGFYLQVKEKDLIVAKNLLNQIDGYVATIIENLETMVKSSDLPKGDSSLIKKEVMLVDGAPWHRVYIDLAVVPQALAGILNLIPEIKNEGIELYYGLENNNILFLALDFDLGIEPDENHQKLGESSLYREAIGELAMGEGIKVAYFEPKPLIAMIDKYLQLAQNFGKVDAKVGVKYQKIKKILEKMKYFVSSAKISALDAMTAEAFLRIEP